MYFPGGKGKVAPVHPRDVAAVATTVLTQPGHNGRAYELTGPELLSMDEMVRVIAKALNKPLTYTDIPPFAAKIFMLKNGMDRILVKALMEMMSYLRKNKGAIMTDTVQKILGCPPQSFEIWCNEQINLFRI